jgi:hypothetical protein
MLARFGLQRNRFFATYLSGHLWYFGPAQEVRQIKRLFKVSKKAQEKVLFCESLYI